MASKPASPEIEIWKEIKDYEGYYEASSLGRIRSLDRWSKVNGGLRFRKGQIMRLAKYPKSDDPDDYYLGIHLYKDGEGKCVRVNRVIAQTFIPNPNNLPEVNHLDRIKWNNRVENLEWSEPREQTTHRFLNEKKTSKYTGVSWHKQNSTWASQIQIKGKKIMLGYFQDEETARDHYLNALKKYGLENKYAIQL